MIVQMVRDAKLNPDSHHANVRQDDVAAFEAAGWSRADAPDQDGKARKGRGRAVDPLDVPQPDAGGLTLRELHADLEASKVDFDPAASAADLYAARQAAKAEG